MSPSTRRTRALASLAAVAGLGLAGAAVGAAPAQSAAPAGDCPVAFPVADVANGDAVTGLTVSRGTTPEGFTGEVLGVLDDAIGPGVDMIMVRLTSPEIDRVGIWQGMSGSPVYAEDGRLVGAVSYGLAMGGSPVAGVTPYEAMDDHLADPAATIAVDGATARRIARGSDVSARQAKQGFEQIPMPLGVVGVGPARLAAAADRAGDRTWVPRSAYAMGHARGTSADAGDLVPGGNLGASLSYGDVTMGGVGTVTAVCGDRLVGFGHPMTWAGATTLGLHPADAVYVQEDLVAGFKLANLADPVGTITDDRLAGITGTIGDLPTPVDASTTLTYGDHTRTGVTHVVQQVPDTLASAAFYGLIANHQTVVDGPVVGTEDFGWTISGTDGDGAPFTLDYDNLYASTYDLTWDLGFGLGDFVYTVSGIPGVSIDSISSTGSLRDDVTPVHLDRLEVRRGGEWVQVNRRTALTVRGGGTLVLRVTTTTADTATSEGTTAVTPVRLQVPRSFASARRPAYLQALGGRSDYPGRMPHDVQKLAAWLDGLVRGDQLVVRLERGDQQVQTVLGPLGGVVHGRVSAPVMVR